MEHFLNSSDLARASAKEHVERVWKRAPKLESLLSITCKQTNQCCQFNQQLKASCWCGGATLAACYCPVACCYAPQRLLRAASSRCFPVWSQLKKGSWLVRTLIWNPMQSRVTGNASCWQAWQDGSRFQNLQSEQSGYRGRLIVLSRNPDLVGMKLIIFGYEQQKKTYLLINTLPAPWKTCKFKICQRLSASSQTLMVPHWKGEVCRYPCIQSI